MHRVQGSFQPTVLRPTVLRLIALLLSLTIALGDARIAQVRSLPAAPTTARQVLPPVPVDSAGIALPSPVVTWTGGEDGRWSDPANWKGGRVPGPGDVARFAGMGGVARADAAFGGRLAGLIVEATYRGEVRLERALQVSGAARVSGGVLLTPEGAALQALTLHIDRPGVVRLGTNGSLELSGDGEPLTGDGELDTLTHRPNSVQYTGRASVDLTQAGPAGAWHGLDRTTTASPDFSYAGSLPFNLGESHLSTAVIDPAGGYAYFGTYSGPGVVVKVRLSDFTRVGALTLVGAPMLGAGEGGLLSAVIDPAGDYAYFGTGSYPGHVIKVRLFDFSLAGVLTLHAGEDWLTSAVMDPSGGYAYFGTATSPGIVVKVRLSDFARVGALTFNYEEDGLSSAVMDPAGDYAYFGANARDGRVVKVRLSDFTRVGALTISPGVGGLHSAVIDPVGAYAYFGSSSSPGHVVKIRLSDFTQVGTLTLNIGEDWLASAVIDSTGDYAYFGTAVTPGRVVKVRLSDLTRVGALAFSYGEKGLSAAVVDPADDYAYFGTDAEPGRVLKVRLSDFTWVDVLTLTPGENELDSAVIDPGGGYAYFGTGNLSGRVVKVRLSDFTHVGVLTLGPGEENLNSAVIDPGGGYAYFGTSTTVGDSVVRVRLSDFTRVDALALSAGESSLKSAVIDPAAGYAYFGTGTYPGRVVRVRLSDFTRVDALTLNSGENYLYSAAVDPAGGYAYFGTATSPGIVVKVRLSDFTREGALTLDAGEDHLSSAAVDPAGGYAYFGTATSPGIVVKVRLSDFTRVDALTLNESVGSLFSAAIDPGRGYAYFGTHTSPGSVIRVRLSDFTQAGALELNPGQDWLHSAVIDPAGGYAYFGTGSWHGQVVRINLTERPCAITVHNAADHGPGSLRQALADVCNGGVVDFAGDYTIHLTHTLTVDRRLTIDGSGRAITISGDTDDDGTPDLSPFSIGAAGVVTLTHLNIVDSAGEQGGGIRNAGELTLLDSTLSGNAAGYGGGIYNAGTLVVRDSTLSGNAAGYGGGIFSTGVLTMYNSALIDNSVDYGGGIYNTGTLRVHNGVFSGNSAGCGGGLYTYVYDSAPRLMVENALFSGNAALHSGGGLYNRSDRSSDRYLTLAKVTMSGNTAGLRGGALYNQVNVPILVSDILWGNAASEGAQIYNDSTTPNVTFCNVQGGQAGFGNIDADPRFSAPVAAGSAPTSTGNYRLGAGSPSIDAGQSGAACPADDLDRAARPAGFGCDMGAYETHAFTAGVRQSASHLTPACGQVLTLTVVVSNTGPGFSGGRVTDALPDGLHFVGPITLRPPGAGTAGSAPPTLAHGLTLSANQQVTLSFPVSVTWDLTGGRHLTHTVLVTAPALLQPAAGSVTLVVNDAPFFASVPAVGAVQDAPYTYTVAAGDPDLGYGDVLTLTAAALPAWLALADHGSGTAELSGTPANADVGAHAVVLHVTDHVGLAATQSFSVSVANVNDLPAFSSTPVDTATQDLPYTYAVAAGDPDLIHGDVLTLTAPSLPAWLALDDHGDGTAALSGVPGADQVGPHTVTLQVQDRAGAVDTQSFTLNVANVNDPPDFTSTPLIAATQGLTYTYRITVADPDLAHGDRLTLTALALPGWLTLADHGDGTGRLDGRPGNAQVGRHPVILRVADRAGAVDTQAFAINVANTNDPPAFSSAPVVTATQAAGYTYTVTAVDADLAYGDRLTLTAPVLPGWLALVDQGGGRATLSGTPANADVGQHVVTLQVTDAGGLSAVQGFTLTVVNANDPPCFTSQPVVTATGGALYTYTVAAGDPDLIHGDVLTLSAPSLPAWLTLEDHGDGTALLSGTPGRGDVGTHSVALRVTDGLGASAGQAFGITVVEQPYHRIYVPLVLRSVSAQQGNEQADRPRVHTPIRSRR